MASKNKKKKSIAPVKKKPLPDSIERGYARTLQAIIKELRPKMEPLIKELKRLEQRENAERFDADKKKRDVKPVKTILYNTIKTEFDTIVTKKRANLIAQGVDKKTTAFAMKTTDDQVRGIVTLPPSGVGEHKGFVKDNVGLIKSIPKKLFGQIEEVVTDNWTKGKSTAELTNSIEERFGVANRRARLIARDQIGKLNAEVTQERHKELGIEKYKWNCVAADSVITAINPRLVSRSFFSGEMRRINVSGNSLTVTPEHKVLTNRGWIRADRINDSDYLIRYSVVVNNSIKGSFSDFSNSILFDSTWWGPNKDCVPTKISDFFSSCNNSLSRLGMVFTAVDLDSERKDSDVNIVPVDGLLKNDIVPFGFKDVGDLNLVPPDEFLVSLICQRDFNPILITDCSEVGSKFFHFVDDKRVRLFGNEIQLSISEGSGFNVKVMHDSPDCRLCAVEPFGEISGGHSFIVKIEYQRCIGVDIIPFSGHVYDLSTDEKWFTCNSFVVHNCSLDERVRGNPSGLYPKVKYSHWARHNKIFRYDSPPPDGHPGVAIQCRCSAIPIIPELEGLDD